MSSTLDVINEVRKKYGQLPIQNTGGLYNADGYTNDNDLGTLAGALGIGTANMANNTLVGGTGYALGNLGRFVEWLSPFSGETITPNDRRALANIGYNAEQINQLAPYEDSWITSGAKGVLSAHNAIGDSLNDWRSELLGDNPTTLAKMAEGSGSSIGYMLAALALGTTPLGSALIAGAGEALSEAGSFMGDAYRNGQYDDGALSAANKGFAANTVLNTGLNYLLSPFGKIAGNVENPVARYLVGTGTETLNELLQEPSQQVIEQAATNSLNNGTDFMSEVGESVKQLPEIFSQLAPEVAGSTLMTQALLAPMGIKANYAYNQGLENVKGRVNAIDERLANIPQNEETRKLIEDRNAVFNAINKLGYNNNWKGLNQSLIHLNNLENAINNYGKSAEEIKADKQPAPAPNPVVAPTSAPETDGSQLGLDFTEMFNPSDKKPDTKKELAPIEVGEAPEIQTSPQEENTAKEKTKNRNIARVRTIAGTEVDVRYRAIEADDLITSHTNNGTPNPNYPQELQPRDRSRAQSSSQIDDLARNIDPKMLGANRLVSDGAPVIGPDMIVESGNGRTLGIKKAYSWNSEKAKNYRQWIIDNAEVFGLNPEYIANMKNPVLVRERTSDIDRVKFTSEANRSSIATKSDAEFAMEDASKIKPELLQGYDTESDFTSNTSFIARLIHAIVPDNEKGNLLQRDGSVAKAGNDRVLYALAAKAYNDKTIIERLSEKTDDEIKNISKALINAAPEMAIFESINTKPEFSLKEDIMQANEILANLRKTKQKVSEYLATLDIDPKETTQKAKKLLRLFGENMRKPSVIEAALRYYAKSAMSDLRTEQSGQATMFDISRTSEQILDEAIRITEEEVKKSSKTENNDIYAQSVQGSEEQLRQDFKQQAMNVGRSEDEAEAESHLFIAMNKSLAKYAGLSLEKYIKADNLSIVYTPKIDDVKGHNVRARTEFSPEKRNIFGDIEQEAQTIIRVSKLANQSSIIHEMGHIFLHKLQRLAQSGQLKGVAEQDWKVLLKNYGISKLDFNNMSDADLRAWTDTHEKFATDFERYMMTGEAPSSKMKHIFEQFKRWLTNIYHSIQDIKYVGSDGQAHSFELSPEMKEVFDHLLGGNEEKQSYNQTVNNDIELNNKKLLFTGRPTPAISSGSNMNLARASSNIPGKYAAKGDLSQKQSFNEILRSDTESVNKSDIESYNQIIGEQGAKRLDKQEGVTTRMDYLSIAKGMEEADKETKVIRYATGWERGKDGKWRYEIMDSDIDDAKIYENMEQNDIPFTMKLSDVYKNEELLTAYPSLKDIDVKFTDELENGTKGQFEGKKIKLSTDYSINSIRSTLIHEIQHAIQDIEGFANGGNPEQFIPETDAPRKRFQKELDSLDKRSGIEKLRQELQGKVINGKIKLEDAEKEIEKARKNSPYDNLYAKLQDEVMQHEEWLKKKYKGNTKPYDIYRSLAGEVEARNAQARMDLTKKERKNTLLSDTEDVNRDRQIENYNQAIAADDEDDEIISVQEQIDAVRKQYEGTDKWLKAPNGKKSNLSEKQWLQVRTPNFKKWFGDWEAAYIVKNVKDFLDNSKPVGSISGEEFSKTERPLPDRVLDFYRSTGNTLVHNRELGDVILDKRGVKDSAAHGLGKEKSAAFALVPDVIKNGLVYDRQNEWKGRKYNTATLIANVKIGGKDYVCEVIVKQSENKQGFYLHEVEIKEKLDSVFKTAPNGTLPSSRLIISDYVKKAENVSKVVDENGEPLVVERNGKPVFVNNTGKRKSATDNRGTFDSNNPDIYYQAFSPRKSLIQRLKDWIKGKNIEERGRLFSSADATNNADYSFDNEESERRWEEAKKGIQQPTAPQRIKRATLNLLHSFRGDYPELAGNKELNFAREAFRKLGRAKSAQVHKSMKTFTENLGKLSKRQLDLFARKRLLDDLMWRKRQVPDAELPFDFTDESLKKEYEKFTKIAENDKAVMKAIHDEEQTMQAISKEFADLAGNLGLNLDKVFKNPHYFRHSILEYANAAAVGTRRSKGSQNTEITNNGSLQDAINSKLNDIRNRSFLKKYKGSNLDINMNYTQAMGEVRAQMLMDIETMKTLLDIKEHYDKAPELREALKKAFTPPKGKNESHNQDEGVKLSEIIPEGYTLYNPAGSRLIQSANTTAENVLAMAIDDASEKSGLPLDEILNSMGTTGEEFFNQLWIIPKEIKETLRKMSKGRDRGLLGNTARVITRSWKKLVLFSPTRNLKYNFRNFTGDLDAVIAGNPSALKFFGQSVKELTAYYTGKEATQDLKDYMERSGGMKIESMSFSDNEVKELQSLAEILKDKNSSIPKKGWNLIKKFFANEVAFTQWREHLLRYAAYLAYKQDMKANNGVPSTWGASIKDEVMSLIDNRDKAYKMSNELLGAYDQVSNTGKQLRETLIPFYSWMEVNIRRYYRLLKNGFSGQNSSDFTKRLLLGQTARVPFYALTAAETTAKIAALTLAVQMFNRMVFGDDDDELPNDVKYRPHLTLGKVNGKVYYFDRIGALADAADWLSLDSIFIDAQELANGQQSIGGYLKKMAQAPVNKIINGLNPILKMPIELATGRTMYPDAFNSRTIRDNGKYIAQSLGLAWPYKAITGEPRNDWDELSRMLIYSLDPDEAAYFQTLDKVRQFQERVLDKKFDGFATTRRGKVLQNLKRALRYNDRDAIKRYLKEYAKVDGTNGSLRQSMKAMNPLFGLSKDERKQFLKWLTPDDRKYLRKADKYFHELTSRFLR